MSLKFAEIKLECNLFHCPVKSANLLNFKLLFENLLELREHIV